MNLLRWILVAAFLAGPYALLGQARPRPRAASPVMHESFPVALSTSGWGGGAKVPASQMPFQHLHQRYRSVFFLALEQPKLRAQGAAFPGTGWGQVFRHLSDNIFHPPA